MIEGPSFVIGNIAKGEDLWNRQEEIESIWRALPKGSILLKAPRRFGKTSIMYNLYENPKMGFKVFYQDTEGMSEPQDLISALMTKLLLDSKLRNKLKPVTKWLKNIVGQIEEIGVADVRLKIKEGIKKDWKEKGLELIYNLTGHEEKILFLIDELPILVQNITKRHGGEQSAREFLHWFRGIRQMPELSQTRWVVGGSIGIEHVLEKVGAGTKVINDFQIIRIGPFSKEDGRTYVRKLLESEGQIKQIPSEIIEKFLELIGSPIPYFIQILIKESLYEMRRRKQKALNSEVIEKAYQEEV
ncbi:MAG: hypothetical protein AB1478_06375, partial [Nitrospirota bacterium]